MERYWVLRITDWDNNNTYFKISCNITYDYLYKIISSIAYSYDKILKKYTYYVCRRGNSVLYPGFLTIIKSVIINHFEINELNNDIIKNISENTIKDITIDDIKFYLRRYHGNREYYCYDIYNKKIIYDRITRSQIFYDNDYNKYYFNQGKNENLENNLEYKTYYEINRKKNFYHKQMEMNHVLFNFEEIKDELSIDYYPDDKEIDKVVAIILKKRLNKIGKEEEQEEYEY